MLSLMTIRKIDKFIANMQLKMYITYAEMINAFLAD
jgi:hypothetical protein